MSSEISRIDRWTGSFLSARAVASPKSPPRQQMAMPTRSSARPDIPRKVTAPTSGRMSSASLAPATEARARLRPRNRAARAPMACKWAMISPNGCPADIRRRSARPALELAAVAQEMDDGVLEHHLGVVGRAPAHLEGERHDLL